jgi:hypothetical protein
MMPNEIEFVQKRMGAERKFQVKGKHRFYEINPCPGHSK